MQTDFDILIVGDGLIGQTLCCALANTGLSIGLIAAPIKITNSLESNQKDERSLALSLTSHRILKALSIWPHLSAKACPIKEIHVSDKGHFGFAHLTALKNNQEALGFVVPITILNQSLATKVANLPNLKIIPSTINKVTQGANNLSISIETNDIQSFTTKVLIATDGEKSQIRNLLNIKTFIQDYNQTAIVANVGLKTPASAIAYERFTKEGPLALLPLDAERYSLVWTTKPNLAHTLLKLPAKEFLKALQLYFGYRLGKFIWVGERQTFPLKLIQANNTMIPNVVLLGNASHTLHPIAGQGFNLGLRALARLTDIIINHLSHQEINDYNLLIKKYNQAVYADQRLTIKITDTLVHLFSNEYQPLSLLRNLGLIGFDIFPGFKKAFTKRAIGLQRDMPQLMLCS